LLRGCQRLARWLADRDLTHERPLMVHRRRALELVRYRLGGPGNCLIAPVIPRIQPMGVWG
jgi:hypothetical protein